VKEARIVALVFASTCLAGAAAAAGSATAEPKRLVIGDKGFTESRIVAQLYAQALSARGFFVEVESLATAAQADRRLRNGEIQMYPEYTGTALQVLLGRDASRSSAANFARIRGAYAGRGLTALPRSPYSNDNRVACTAGAARRLGLTTLSDLGTPDGRRVRYAANPEHLTRADGLPLLRSAYGARPAAVVRVPVDRRYDPVRAGRADCVYAFGTDPQIAALGLRVLRDDRGRFQGVPFESFPVVSTRWLRQADPAFRTTVNRVSALLTPAVVRGLNAAVDLRGRTPEQAAAALLTARGIVR
jgi:osmoprotectant transport system substrate-binding protein